MDSAKPATAPEEAAHAIIMVMLTSAYTKFMSVVDYLVAIPPRAMTRINELTSRIKHSMPDYIALGPLTLLIIAKGLVIILSVLAYDVLPALLFSRVLDGILPALPQRRLIWRSSAPTQDAHNGRSDGIMFVALVVATHLHYSHFHSGGDFYDGYRKQLQIWTAVLISTGLIWALVKAATLI